MIRTLFLVLAILAVLVTPRPAHGGGGRHGGPGHHHSHHRGHHGHHFSGLLYAPFPYGFPCWAEEGYWIDQLYMDRYGNSTYVPLRVPPRWDCWY